MRPPVVHLFLKNAHNYKKDYSVDIHTLGRQTVQWWGEICPPSGAPKVRFGGPTGIYTLVVLLSWWCLLVRTKPVHEHADCLRTLTDVNHTLLTAVDGLKSHPTASASALLPPASPPLPSQSRKRANIEEVSSRKRTRSGKV